MSKPTKAPRDPWRPKKPKKDLRVQFSTWTTQLAKSQFDEWHGQIVKQNPGHKTGDTLAIIVAFAAVTGFRPVK